MSTADIHKLQEEIAVLLPLKAACETGAEKKGFRVIRIYVLLSFIAALPLTNPPYDCLKLEIALKIAVL